MSEPQLREEQTLNVTAEKTPSSASVAMVPKETYMMKANLVAAPSIAPVPLMKSKEHVQFHPPTPTEKQAPVSFEVGEAKSSITSSLEKIVVHKVGESPQEGQNGSDFNAQPKTENTKTSDGTQPPQNGFDNRPQADAIEEVKPEPIIIPVSMSPCRSPDSANERVNGTTTSFEDKKEVTMEATVTFSKSFDDSSTNDVTQILAPNQPSSGATGTKPEELAQKAPETGDQTPKVASQEGQPPVDEVNNKKDEQGLPEAGKDGNTSTGATMNGTAISSEVTIESKSQSFDYVALVNGLSTGENGKSEVVGGLVASTIPEEKKDEEALEKKINLPVLACELRKCPEDEKTDGQTGLQANQDKPSDTDASPLPAAISDIVSHKPDFNDYKSTEMTTVVTMDRKEEKSKYDDDDELPERPRSSADLIAAAQAAAAELSALSQAAEHELLQYRRSESRKASVGAGDSLRKRDDSLSDNSAQNSTALDVTPQNSLAEPIPELPTDEKRISAISAEADALRAAIEAANIPIVADDKPKVEEPVEKKVDEVEAKKPVEEMDNSVEKKDGEVKTQPDSTLEEPKKQDQAEQQAQAPPYASLVGGLITTESGSLQVVGGLVLIPVTKQAQQEELLVQKPKEQEVETKEPEEVQQDANPIEGAQGNDQKPLDQVLASNANASDDKKADDSTSGHPSGEAPTIPESFLELKHKEPEHNELPFECTAPSEPSPSSGDVDEKKEETAVGSEQQKTEEPKVESGKMTPPVIPEIIVDLAHKEPEHTELPFEAVAPSEPSPAVGGDEKQENADAKPDDAQKTEAACGNEAQKADSGSEVNQSAQTSQDNEKSNDQPSTDITVNADVTIQRVEPKPIEADHKNEVALGSADSPKNPESAEISVESFDAKPVEAKEQTAKPEEKPSDDPKEPSIHVSETPKPSEDEKKPCEEKPTESADAAKAEQREQEQKSAVEVQPECSGAEASASAEKAHSDDEVKLSESMSAEPSTKSKLAEAGEKATEAVEANKDEQKPSEKLTAQETKPAEKNVEPKAEESTAATEDKPSVPVESKPSENTSSDTSTDKKPEEKPAEESKPVEEQKPAQSIPQAKEEQPTVNEANNIAWISDADDAKPKVELQGAAEESKPTPSAFPDDGIEWICDDGKKKDPEPQAPVQEKVPEPAEAAPVESAKPAAMKEEPKEEAKTTQPASPSDLEQGCEKLREVPTICESAPTPSSPPKDDNHINFDIDQYEKKMNEKTEEMKALVDKLFDKSQQAKKNNEALAKMALEVAADPPTQHHKKRVSFDAMAFGPIGGGLPSNVESVILGRNVLVHPTGVDILPDGNILVTDKERGIFLFSIEGEIVKHLQNESWKEPCAPYAHRSYVLLVQSVRNGDGFWERMICKFSLDMNLISRIECPMWIKENMPVVVSERICVSPAENIYLTVNADTFTGLYELTPGGQWTELDYKLDERFTDICAFCIVGPVTQILVIEGRKNYVHLYSIINGQVAERRKLGVVERPGAITQDEEGNLFVLNKAAACIFTVDTLSWCAHKAVTVVDQVITHFACSRGLIAVPLRDCLDSPEAKGNGDCRIERKLKSPMIIGGTPWPAWKKTTHDV
ncbi:unnamed protein product, partial [Mesorhabditis spiculigera]